MSKLKFLATVGGVQRELTPLGIDKLAKSWNRDSEQVYYRETLEGDLLFIGADFAFLFAHETGPTRCDLIPFVVQKHCASGWQDQYSGSLSTSDGEWNVSSCSLKIKAQQADEYSCLTSKWEEKINILGYSINNKTVTPVEGVLEYQLCDTDATPGSVSSPYWCGAGIPEDFGWAPMYDLLEHISGGLDHWRTMWVRETKTVLSSVTLTSPWILISDNGTNRVYARPALLYNYQDLTNVANDIVSWYTYDVVGAGVFPTFDNGVHLNELLTLMLSQACPSLTLKSNFYQSNPDTISGVNYVTGLNSTVRDLILFQKSDIRRSGASQNATKAMLSLKELLNALKVMHNVRYKIEGSVFRLEHLSYFSNTLGLNLNLSTYANYVRGKQIYTYDKSRMPKYEEFKMREATYLDFVGLPISYDSYCVNQDSKNNKQSYSTDAILTDVQGVLDQSSDTENLEGIVMIATAPVSGGLYAMLSEPGILEPTTRPNNSQALAQLHRDYHRHGRILDTGNMNGVATAFLSTIQTKKGAKLSVPLCCGDTFDPQNMVSTMLGDGQVDQASYNLLTEMLELQLMYS